MRNLALGSLLLAAVFGLQGCKGELLDNPTGGGGTFDAQAIETNLAAMDRLTSTPALVSFRNLSTLMTGVNAAAPNGARSGTDRLATALLRLAASGGPEGIPVVGGPLLGKTFVLDGTGRSYVADPNRTGAPQNAVRFVLYQTAGDGHTPVPGTEIGYVDMIDADAASESEMGLRFQVVSGGVTYLDYTTELAGATGDQTLTASGFATDGVDRLNFDLTATGQVGGQTGPVSIQSHFSLPATQFTVSTNVQRVFNNDVATTSINVTLQVDQATIITSGTILSGQLNGSVLVDGAQVGALSGDPASPVVQSDQLVDAERQAVRDVTVLAGSTLQLFDELLGPGAVLMGVSISLI